MKTLHIYTRVSTVSQERDSFSIDSQKEMGINLSKRLGFKYKIWNEGGKSSYKDDLTNRPKLYQLFELVKNGKVKNIWVFNTDRLGRKDQSWYYILSILIKHKVNLYVGDSDKRYDFSTPTDKLVITVLSSISQYDNELRRLRSRIGKINKLKRNESWIGGTISFGYSVQDGKLIKHPEESKMVKNIFDWYNKGMSVQEIKMKLDQSQFAPRRSKRGWNIGTINMMLRKTSYVGYVDYNWKDDEGKIEQTIKVNTPQIITKRVWESVRKKVQRDLENRNQINRSKHESLLKGLLYCEHCNLKLRTRIKPNQKHYYGPCKEINWKKPDSKPIDCKLRKSLDINKTNEIVWKIFIDVLQNSHLIREEFKNTELKPKFEKKEKIGKSIQRINNKIKQLKLDYDNLINSLSQLEFDFYTQKKNEQIYKLTKIKLENNIEVIEKEIKDKEEELLKVSNVDQWVDWVNNFQKWIQKQDELTLIERKEQLFDRIKKIGVSYNDSTKEHTLNIHFDVPIVDDQYKLTEGKEKQYEIIEGNYIKPIKWNFRKENSSMNRKQELYNIIDECRKNKMTYESISKFLNEQGIKTSTKKRWKRNTVQSFYQYQKELLFSTIQKKT